MKNLPRHKAWVANEEARLNAGAPVPSGRVARLVELLMTLNEPEE